MSWETDVAGKMRTEEGEVTAEARERHGMDGKYPIFDQKSCVSAVRLRHHGHGVASSEVLDKAARWAGEHGNAT